MVALMRQWLFSHLPANDVLQRDIEPLLTRPVGRLPNAPVV
jgi:hypothetical protein